ncbi:hypothetical protein SARC_02477 [Sphaeroforma arctica JP610]|uniref:Uncharacterized protein n=1 Tax=Sphaeroforma arctica JP610 TaxID=667725 RepID=A0A0L0G8J9_9EUKA|nr:hypothetical protein SARC_02477 [Sphaeroforma arctica JP610]KNC85330.1 hypothetical protein SARC_02477 [Sphaeroforma arctica JP610]|eukprot:XP_014159232.1 hypothetical protein SARC_02477 [Sphaeroforma arctica JP610]
MSNLVPDKVVPDVHKEKEVRKAEVDIRSSDEESNDEDIVDTKKCLGIKAVNAAGGWKLSGTPKKKAEPSKRVNKG